MTVNLLYSYNKHPYARFSKKLNESHRGFMKHISAHTRSHSLIFVTDQGSIVHLSNINFDSAANEMIYLCNKNWYVSFSTRDSFLNSNFRHRVLLSGHFYEIKLAHHGHLASKKKWKLSWRVFQLNWCEMNLTKLVANYTELTHRIWNKLSYNSILFRILLLTTNCRQF